jgi:hypothetical protein
MINFFRKIRKKMADDNKPMKYLRYAIGEILLVVVGILIAESINNWNTNRVNRQLERQYLSSIVKDLKFESQAYQNTILNKFQFKVDALMLAKKYAYGNYVVKDTLSFLEKVGLGGVFSIGGNFDNGSTYQELISTSNFKLIKKDSIKSAIIDYYTIRMDVSQYANNLRTDYARYNNSLKPYTIGDKNYVDPLDIKRMLKRLKSDEFIDLINQELTFAHSFKSRVENLNQMALKLGQDIEKELDK